MKVAHRGFEAFVTEHDLEIMHEGAVLERVGGVGMSQTVGRHPIEGALVGCQADGPLEVGLVTSPPHYLSGAWMTTQASRGEQPRAPFGQTGLRVLPVEQARKGNGNTPYPVSSREGLGDFELPG